MRKLAALAVPMVLAGLMAKSQSSSSIAPLTASTGVFRSPETEKYAFHWPGRTMALENGGRPGTGDTIREISFTPLSGRKLDTVPKFDWNYTPSYYKPFPYKTFILSAAMVAYGFAGLHVSGLKSLNGKVKEEVWTEDPHRPMHADNYLMYVPAAAVYALNAAGIHGEHNFKDRTMLLLMSQIFAQGTVFSLKSWTHTLRPDGSAYNSFPSGHTAEAFANAEFMRQEYKDVSVWYGIAGYAVATTTGLLRMYNNKHWLNDVVAGAGIGIASTRLSYWLYPKIQHWLFHDRSPGTVLMPSYNNGSVGLTFAHHF